MNQTFEEWWVAEGWQYGNDPKATAEAAWNESQHRIHQLNHYLEITMKNNKELRAKIQENNDEC